MEAMHMEGRAFDRRPLLQKTVGYSGTTAHTTSQCQEVLGDPWRCEKILSMWSGSSLRMSVFSLLGLCVHLAKSLKKTNKQEMWFQD